MVDYWQNGGLKRRLDISDLDFESVDLHARATSTPRVVLSNDWQWSTGYLPVVQHSVWGPDHVKLMPALGWSATGRLTATSSAWVHPLLFFLQYWLLFRIIT